MNNKIRISKDDQGRVKVTFLYDPDLVMKIKTVNGYKWHPEEKYWSFPYSKEVIKRMISVFGKKNVNIDEKLLSSFKSSYVEALSDLERELEIRKYSKQTIKLYMHTNVELLYLSKKMPSEIDDSDIKNYLLYLADNKKAATSTINVAINALKFYYGAVKKIKFIYDIKRPKKDKKLPVVLSLNEIERMLSTIKNLKHKAILMVAYSGGLRVSDVVGLRVMDIDPDRKVIYIRNSKGRKDRQVNLSDTALKFIIKYKEEFKPTDWLFPGMNPNKHIAKRTAQQIIKNVLKEADIIKDATMHSLRHSYATHLLESGVDIRYIQELLGHKSIKTTEIYTKVSKKNIEMIKNPLDEMVIDD